MENITSESGIFNSSLMQKINRKCKPCIFSEKLKRNLTKYLFDFFYYRELHQICSANLFFYQCFTEYQLMTWKIEMNNIIDIFHLDINNYDEEVDETLTKCIQKKRIYSMKDHPGCYIRINKEGLNIISLVYYDSSIPKECSCNSNDISPIKKIIFKENSIDSNSNYNITTFAFNDNNGLGSMIKQNTIESISEGQSNLGSMESITNNIKNDDIENWKIKNLDDSYNNNQCIILNKTSPLNFGFSFYHVIKGDYQLYLHHSLINMKNARLILQVSINGNIVYTLSNFPSNELVSQDIRDEKEKEKNIKLKEYLICSITKKMFEESNYTLNGNEIEDNNDDDEKNKFRDYEVRVTFKNQDLFWKAGWCIDGGRLLRKVYEVIESNVNKNLKRFKSEDINIFGSVNMLDNKECNQGLRKSIKRNTLQVSTDKKI
jgi:hypothetical protein